MKRLSLLLLLTLTLSPLFAGGIVTNTNQSAMFTRLQARDATLGIDAVYYNPAGLSFLSDNGFYISLNNQFLTQTRNIGSNYPYLNEADYVGDISAPIFPGIYAAYKLDKFVFSVGFNPIGGGGGGKYQTGLPFFEYSIADLVPSLSSQGASAYRLDAYFEGTSAFLGYQANVSYKVNDKLAFALGGRYVQANESYNGSLTGIDINMGGTWMPASDVMQGISAQATAGAASASGAATNMQPLIDGGAGIYTFPQAQDANVIDATTKAQLEGGLSALGIDPAGLTIAQAQAAYSEAATALSIQAARSGATATILEDQAADYSKSAWGITPILSIDYKPNDQLNFSFKYEHQTKLEFTNKTKKDFTTGYDANGKAITMFPDGQVTRLDLPTQIAAGASYRPTRSLLISTGYHLYLDKNANWDGRQELLDGNSWEAAVGIEYDINESFLVSAGYLRVKSGSNGNYQNSLSYSLPSNTLGGGFKYNINTKADINFGISYTMFESGDKAINHDLGGSGTIIPITESYDKDVFILSIGINYKFSKHM